MPLCIFILLSITLTTIAVPWDQSIQTDAALFADYLLGWTPRPTPSPHNIFMKRFTDTGSRALCGFDPGELRCSASSTCLWNTDISAVGCCNTGSCDFRTSCIPSSLRDSCNGICATNTLNLFCTDSVTAYCHTITDDPDGAYYTYLCATNLPDDNFYAFLTQSPATTARYESYLAKHDIKHPHHQSHEDFYGPTSESITKRWPKAGIILSAVLESTLFIVCMACVITHLVLWRKRSQRQPDKSANSELLTLPHAQTELHSHDAVSLTEEGEAANSELLTIPHSQGGLYTPSNTTFTEDVEAAESELSTVAHAQGMVYPPNAASFAKERGNHPSSKIPTKWA